MPSPCTVTCQLQTAADVNLQGNSFVRFRLRNFAGFVPRVDGVGIIAEPQIDVLPNAGGVISTTLWGNDNIDPTNTYYTVEWWAGGRITSQANFIITGASFDLDSAAQLNPPPQPGTSGLTPLLLETSGVKNGSQQKFNAVAGSGMSIVDDGVGNITFSAGGGSGSIVISAVQNTGGVGSTPVNLSTEGAKDFLGIGSGALTDIFTSSAANVHSKLLGGWIRSSFRVWGPLSTVAPTSSTNTPWTFTTTIGDDDVPGGTFGNNLLSAVNFAAGEFSNTSTLVAGGWGFKFEVPASSTSRTCSLYIGVNSGGAATNTNFVLTARLADGSATDKTFTITPGVTGLQWYKVTITYQSGGAWVPLIVEFAVQQQNGDSGTLFFFAAVDVA